MRRTAIALLLFLITTLVGTVSVRAQTERKLTSTSKAFQVFYAKFRSAVIKKDKLAVASQTRFPFEYGWDAGDEGTYTKSQFLKKYGDIFEGARKLFMKRDPTFYIEDGVLNVTNYDDASHYLFRKTRSGYKFTAIIVEP